MVQVSKVFVIFLFFLSMIFVMWFYMKNEWKKSHNKNCLNISVNSYYWNI